MENGLAKMRLVMNQNRDMCNLSEVNLDKLSKICYTISSGGPSLAKWPTGLWMLPTCGLSLWVKGALVLSNPSQGATI